ncbi:hypothetical protein [Paenibacillus peoriae]|uniref:hypothetical protein n=1 Tax=Paenibacillus peoriae TaxID=59893 RepID=UPI0015E2794F|nr:hypothetical protein [Paenibacillus peoriae]
MHQLKYWLYKSPKVKLTETSTTFRAVAVQHSQHEPLWVQVGAARIVVLPGFEPQLLRDVVAALDLLSRISHQLHRSIWPVAPQTCINPLTAWRPLFRNSLR